jgi:hypothetical protein
MHSLSDKIETTATLPNFLLVGAAKCGTSSLYHYLQQHPDIFMSPAKEPRFFSNRAANPGSGPGDVGISQKCVGSFDEYLKLFQKSKGKKAVGEASVDTMFHFKRTILAIQHYLHDPRIVIILRLFDHAIGKKAIGEASHTNLYYYRKTIPLIKLHLGDPKIIIILRNPVERAFSAFSELALEGRECFSFEEALRQEPKRIAEGWRPTWYYQDLGFYSHQIKAYLDHFSAVKICLFDNLQRVPSHMIQDLYRFLEVDSSFCHDITSNYNISGAPRFRLFGRLFSRKPPLQNIVSYLGKMIFTEDGWASLREKLRGKLLTKTTIRPETKSYLENLYRDDIAKVQILIDRDLSHWLPDSPVLSL